MWAAVVKRLSPGPRAQGRVHRLCFPVDIPTKGRLMWPFFPHPDSGGLDAWTHFCWGESHPTDLVIFSWLLYYRDTNSYPIQPLSLLLQLGTGLMQLRRSSNSRVHSSFTAPLRILWVTHGISKASTWNSPFNAGFVQHSCSGKGMSMALVVYETLKDLHVPKNAILDQLLKLNHLVSLIPSSASFCVCVSECPMCSACRGQRSVSGPWTWSYRRL